MNNTIISNNSITGLGINQGGGINNSSKLTLVNSAVSDNEVRGSGDGLGSGGGIENDSTGTINVISSVISDNKVVSSTKGLPRNKGSNVKEAFDLALLLKIATLISWQALTPVSAGALKMKVLLW